MSRRRRLSSAVMSSPPSAAATGARAPSQNVRPTTAACATRARSRGGSESIRAASTPRTVSGSSAARAEPSSAKRWTISSANSGFPPARSTSAPSSVGLAPASRNRTLTSSWASAAGNGSRNRTLAPRRDEPHWLRRSNSSSLAEHTCRIGARSHSDRYSIRSSMPSSAQWMSSQKITIGSACAIASRHALTPPKKLSRAERMSCSASASAWTPGASAPSRRAIGASRLATCSGASLAAPTAEANRSASLLHATSAGSPSPIPHSARSSSLRGQYTTLVPNGRLRPRLTDTGGALAASRCSNSRARRVLPTPGWPMTVTRWGNPESATRPYSRSSSASSS